MAELTAFLAQNAFRPENRKLVVSARFAQAGEPVQWELRALTGEEDEEIRKKHTRMVQVPGKRGQYRQEFDSPGYLGEAAAASTVFPNLLDATLQDSYKVHGAAALLKTMLLPGEYAEYLEAVQAVNGFVPMEELADAAKN